MDILAQLITILRDIAGLTFNEARELAESIVDLFQNDDIVTQNNQLTIQQIANVLTQVENQSNALIVGKITQSQQIITAQLGLVQNNIINTLRQLLTASNTNVIGLINQTRTDISINSQIIRTQIVVTENSILNRISQLPSIFQQIINQQTQIILRGIDAMTQAISSAILADIRSEQEIASVLNRTLIGLFGRFPTQLADEFYTKFANVLEREPETPLEDLLPEIQDILKNALIDSYSSDEFKRAIHPQENNIMEFIRTIFSGVDATSNAIGEIIDFGSDTGGLIMRLIQLLSPDTLINMAIQMSAEPFLRHLYHKSSRIARSDLLTVEQLLGFYLQDRSRLAFVQNYLRTIGYTEDDINILMTQVNRTITENQVQELFYRDDIDGSQAVQYLRKLGHTDESQNLVRKLWDLIPPVQDIIRMAVRDVFNPVAVDEFGLNENMPSEFVEWAKKQGLNEYWTTKYWASHWNLPSSNQGFEMFQRQIIDETQLKTLLQALDITPKWRDYLIQLNYSPITRVDVRRMHDMGFLTFDEMVTRYRDVGYSPNDANLLGLWTEEYNNRGSDGNVEETRKLTQTVIIRGYSLGLLTQEQALSQLVAIGYNAENAQYLLDLANIQTDIDNIPDRLKDNYRRMETILSKGFITGTLNEIETRQGFSRIGFSQDDTNSEITFLNLERETQLNELIIDLVKTSFLKFSISEDRVQSILAGYGFNSGEINSLIGQWSIIRMHRTDIPTKAEIVKMLEKGIIDLGKAQDFLRGMGYPDETIVLYTRLWTE